MSHMTIEEKIAQMNCYPIEIIATDTAIYSKTEKLLQFGIGQLRDYHHADIETSVDVQNRLQRFLVEKTRLGIPAIIHGEGLHGYVNNGATSFPQAIALAGTWNTTLIDQFYKVYIINLILISLKKHL